MDEGNRRANRMPILKSALYASNLNLMYLIDSVPRFLVACIGHVSYLSRAPVAAPFDEYHVGNLRGPEEDL